MCCWWDRYVISILQGFLLLTVQYIARLTVLKLSCNLWDWLVRRYLQKMLILTTNFNLPKHFALDILKASKWVCFFFFFPSTLIEFTCPFTSQFEWFLFQFRISDLISKIKNCLWHLDLWLKILNHVLNFMPMLKTPTQKWNWSLVFLIGPEK